MFNLKSILPIKKKAKVKRKSYKRYKRPTRITATLSPQVALELTETCEYIGHKKADFAAAAIENYIIYYRGYIADKEDGYV